MLAACQAAPTSRSVNGHGFPWPPTPEALGREGLANEVWNEHGACDHDHDELADWVPHRWAGSQSRLWGRLFDVFDEYLREDGPR